MTNYSILSYMGGCVISAKYEHTGEYLYMGKDGKWGSRDRPEDYFADSFALAMMIPTALILSSLFFIHSVKEDSVRKS